MDGYEQNGFIREENGKIVDYTPISMWGYFGYELLFSIPIAGFICLLVFAFGSRNQNVKNFARSYFCFLIIAVVVFVFMAAMFGTAAGADYLFSNRR